MDNDRNKNSKKKPDNEKKTTFKDRRTDENEDTDVFYPARSFITPAPSQRFERVESTRSAESSESYITAMSSGEFERERWQREKPLLPVHEEPSSSESAKSGDAMEDDTFKRRKVQRKRREDRSLIPDSSVEVVLPAKSTRIKSTNVTIDRRIKDTDDESKDSPTDTQPISTTSTVSEFKPSKGKDVDHVDEISSTATIKSIGKNSKSLHEVKSRTHLDPKTLEQMLQTNLALGDVFIYMAIPPDGGYGWLILIVSFLCQLVLDGILFAVGILLPAMAEDFGVNKGQIVLVCSLQVGPISSALINHYGFRPVALSGVLLAGSSMFIASFTHSLCMMILFYSIIAALGLSMSYLPHQLLIGYYFDQLRPIANGIATSGAALGVTVFALLNSSLVDTVGWRNTTRVHVLLMVFVFLLCITLVEVHPSKIGQIHETEVESEVPSEEEEKEDLRSIQVYTSRDIDTASPTVVLHPLIEEYQHPLPKRENFCRRFFRKLCPTLHKQRSSSIGEKQFIIRPDPIDKKNLYYSGPVDTNDIVVNRPEIKEGVRLQVIEKERTVQDIHRAISMIEPKTATREGYSKVRVPDARPSKRKKYLQYINPLNWMHPKIIGALSVLLGMRLFEMKEFRFLFGAALFYPMGSNIPFVYAKERANVGEHINVLIPVIIGIANFTFRIMSGFVAYKFKPYTSHICGFGIAFGGLVVFISAFYGDDVLAFQLFFSVCFAVAPACFSTLRAIIYVRYLGLEKLTNAIGLTGIAMGFGVFIGTTTGGMLYLMTQRYFEVFAFSGLCLITSGSLLLFLEMYMKRKANTRRNNTFLKSRT